MAWPFQSVISAADKENDRARLAPVMWFFYITISVTMILTGFAAGQWGDGRPGLYCIIWAVAFMSMGMGIGFVFGIPKILQSSPAAADKANGAAGAAYQQQVNTNLTEISDWLTKIIVGAGLIHLKQIPGYVLQAANVLADSLHSFNPAGNYVGLAAAIIMAYGSLGFLFGYLATRLYLAPEFAKADRLASSNSVAIDAVSAEVASLKSELSLVKDSTPSLQKPPTMVGVAPGANTVVVDPVSQSAVDSLAQNYVQSDSSIYSERVAGKEKAANEIARLVMSGPINKSWLTDRAVTFSNDGLIAGLATIINLNPEPGDLDRLARVAQVVKWKHPRFAMAVALGKLFSARIATVADITTATKILSLLSKPDTDDSLTKQIGQTAALIQQITGKPVELPKDQTIK